MTPADMLRNLEADLADNQNSDPDGYMNSGCNEYRCGCHYALPPAARRAIAAEAEADRLRNVCHMLEQENRILREDVKGIIDRECQTLAQELADVRAERDRLQSILDQPVVMLFADGREPTRNERHLRNLLAWRMKEAEEAKVEAGIVRAELANSKAEVTRLRSIIERDRTGLAAGLADVRKIVGGYGWLAREDEWMSYEYHERSEKALRQEMADCIDQVEAAALGALQASGKRVTEAFRPETALDG